MKAAVWTCLIHLAFLTAGMSASEAGQQKIFISGTTSNELYVIDPATNTLVQTIKVNRPHGLAATKDGKFLWVASDWFDPHHRATITRIDTATGQILETHGVPHNDAMALVNDDRDLYIAGFPMGCFYVFDTVDRKLVASFDVRGMAHNVVAPAHDDRLIYLAPMGRDEKEVSAYGKYLGGYTNCAGQPEMPRNSHQIYVVDTSSRKLVDTIETGTAPRPIAVSDDGSWLYANVDDLLGFEIIDLKARRVVQRAEPTVPDSETGAIKLEQGNIVSRSHGIWLTPDQREVWTDSTNDGVVYAFDRSSGTVRFLARIPVGEVPYWLTFSPDGKYGYSSNRGDDTVSVIDVATHKEIKRIALPKESGPHTSLGVALSP